MRQKKNTATYLDQYYNKNSVAVVSMNQQRSGEKSRLARRNKQKRNCEKETWYFFKPWTLSNNTEFMWPLLVEKQLAEHSHGLTTKSLKWPCWQSDTSEWEPNVKALYGVWKVNRERSAERGTQARKQEVRNIFSVTLVFLFPQIHIWWLRRLRSS